jgi:hypothetical protein
LIQPRHLSRRVVFIATALTWSGCGGVGQQIAAGPVLGYASGRGMSAGWEAGGGPFTTTGNGDAVPTDGSLVGRFSLGMSWRASHDGAGAGERLTYAAWEPWFLVGGTFGAAHSSSSHAVQPLLGIWEAAPYVFGGTSQGFSPLPRCSPCFTISLAIGWRWSGAGEFYLSPKVGILNDTTKPFPFSRYPD